MNNENDFREVILKNLKECLFGSLIPFGRTLGARDFLDLCLNQRFEQRYLIAHLVELIDSSVSFSGHYLFEEIDSNYAQCEEEWDGLHGEPVVKEEAAEEASDELEYALECLTHNEIVSLVIQPVDYLVWDKQQAHVDESHHVLIRALSLCDDNHEVGCESA